MLLPVVSGLLLSAGVTLQSGGSADVSASVAECARASSVQVWSITRAPHQPPPGPAEMYNVKTWLSASGGPLWVTVAFVDGRQMNDDCRWTFDTLGPGEYVALITAAHGSEGSQTFSIRSAESINVAIPPSSVTLSGQVRRSDAPAGRVNLRVIPFPFTRPAIVTVTDAEGRYTITLDRPGLHRVEASQIGAAEATLDAGTNVLDVRGP